MGCMSRLFSYLCHKFSKLTDSNYPWVGDDLRKKKKPANLKTAVLFYRPLCVRRKERSLGNDKALRGHQVKCPPLLGSTGQVAWHHCKDGRGWTESKLFSSRLVSYMEEQKNVCRRG